MANKSFVVQYIIKAREKYVQVANNVRESSKKMRLEILKGKKAFAALAPVVKRTADKIKAAMARTKEAFMEVSASMRRKGAVMSAAVTTPIALMAVSLKNAARDAQETRSKFATVFKSMGGEAQLAADKLAKSYGLTGTKARELIGDTGDILTGFGFTEKASLDLSTKMNRLAVDLASFTNFEGGAEGASKALTKALLGEAESVKALGIVIRQDTPEYKNLVNNIMRTQRVSLVQAKALAALEIATKQSKNAVGDFARTLHELANQERITSSRITDLKEGFGLILLPVALKITKAIRFLADTVNNFSPGVKKAILVIAGILAVVGPLLLMLGSVALILPAIKAGFIALGFTALPALTPILLIAGLIAGAAFLIMKNWDKIKDFFKGFAGAIRTTLGPTVSRLVEDFREAAAVIAQLFGADSEAAKNLTDFASIGELVGNVIGEFIKLTIRGLSGIGAIIGQVLGAIVSLDFSQFDVAAIKAEFLDEPTEPLQNTSNVNVGLQVGLDPGLRQTSAATVAANGARRTDVGVITP